jgi:very-short-patch-repair endonuclease
VDALVSTGALVAVLPGVYVPAGAQVDFLTRVRAAVAWDPDVVFTGETAARLTFWPDLPTVDVEAAVRSQRAERPGFRFSRRVVPPELVVQRGPLRVSDPALTALDLCATRDGDGIDQALRSRASTLERMRRALEMTPGRPGNVDRRRLVLDSRDEPWSAAERHFHRILRGARLKGWKPNLPVRVRGSRYFLDVAFPDLKIVVEIDGRLHQTDRGVFESDRPRQNGLVLDGWLVLRFTWRMIEDHPEQVLADVLEAISVKSSAS